MSYYPWHEAYRERIVRQFESNQLAHAILFAGANYLGKFDFALDLARQFLCEAATVSGACGRCSACHLVAAGSHADLRLVQPEDSNQIKIDQIRGLISWASQTAHQGGMKIAIVNPAQQMNHQAANALLKCLEEPGPGTLIFLVTSHSGSLLPTIRSRCQQYKFSAPDREVALQWLSEHCSEAADWATTLDIANGSPLAVMHKFNDDYFEHRRAVVDTLQQVFVKGGCPVKMVMPLLKYDPLEVLEIIQGIVADCIKYILCSDSKPLKNKDIVAEISDMCHTRSSGFFFSAFDRVGADIRVLGGTSNPNKTLLVESLLIDLSDRQSKTLAEYL